MLLPYALCSCMPLPRSLLFSFSRVRSVSVSLALSPSDLVQFSGPKQMQELYTIMGWRLRRLGNGLASV